MTTFHDRVSIGSSETDRTLVSDVITGLSGRPRSLPSKYLYDARGSELFEQITRVPEYYLTRTELGIFKRHLSEMADAIGPDAWLIELGSGTCRKTRHLLDAMDRPRGYMTIEICPNELNNSVRMLSDFMPGLEILPVCQDFTQEVNLPDTGNSKKVAFFPGSTLGNLDADEARKLLRRIAGWVGPGGGLLIGVDLVKSPSVIIPAYDDSAGVTAQFNLNLLRRLNREADADFDLGCWSHLPHWNAELKRMESYLVSLREQTVDVSGHAFDFDTGEALFTERSHKYTIGSLLDLADRFTLKHYWVDDNDWFAVVYLQAQAKEG